MKTNFNINQIRQDFEILNSKINQHNLIYFDNAATSLTPKIVIDEICSYYNSYNANYSRGVSSISNKLTLKVEDIRKNIADFFKINDAKNIVFTKNSTESINIIANGIASNICQGDEIIISEQEHHANILPWINLANKTGAVLKYVKISKNGVFDIKHYKSLVNEKTKIISINHISSTLGYINNIELITKIARKQSQAFVIIDGAQSAGHVDVDLSFGVDGFVCSAHKMCGPTGIGILYISNKLANVVEPLMFGGQMVDVASKDEFNVKSLPFKYEAGTLNLAGIFGFGAAINYINKIGIQNISSHIDKLTSYFLENTRDIKNLVLYNDLTKSHGIISLNLKNVHSHESSSDLDKFGIETRAGSHCSQIYFSTQNEDNNVRISLYFYNTFEELDILIGQLKSIANKWSEISEQKINRTQILKELQKLKQIRNK